MAWSYDSGLSEVRNNLFTRSAPLQTDSTGFAHRFQTESFFENTSNTEFVLTTDWRNLVLDKYPSFKIFPGVEISE